jgi:ataxia telangiectasia mutated family protein
MSESNSSSSLDEDETFFQRILIELIINLTSSHPYHMLPILFAFANSHKDILLDNKSVTSTSVKNTTDAEFKKMIKTEDRVNTANFIIEKVKSNSAILKDIIESMTTLCDSYIELANFNASKQILKNANDSQNTNNSKSIPLAKHLLINKIKNFTILNVITYTLPINKDARYDHNHLVHLVKFEPTFKIANGINSPKIIECHGSDGKKYKQLVKKNDDLRQDAVMQQFFNTFNSIISNSTGKSKLKTIRTYKIVPLSNKSGVLEWCQNTITLGNTQSFFALG